MSRCIEDAHVDEGGWVAAVVNGNPHLANGPLLRPDVLELRVIGQAADHFDGVHQSPSGHREKGFVCGDTRRGASLFSPSRGTKTRKYRRARQSC